MTLEQKITLTLDPTQVYSEIRKVQARVDRLNAGKLDEGVEKSFRRRLALINAAEKREAKIARDMERANDKIARSQESAARSLDRQRSAAFVREEKLREKAAEESLASARADATYQRRVNESVYDHEKRLAREVANTKDRLYKRELNQRISNARKVAAIEERYNKQAQDRFNNNPLGIAGRASGGAVGSKVGGLVGAGIGAGIGGANPYVAAGVAALAVAGGTAALVSSEANRISEYERLAQVSGVSREQFTREAIVGSRFNIEAEDIAEVFKEGSIRARDAQDAIREGRSDPYSEAFRDLNINPDEFLQQSGLERLQTLAQAGEASGLSEAERIRAFEDVLGGEGYERTARLLDAFANNVGEVEAAVESANDAFVPSDTQAARIKEADIALKGLGQEFDNLKVQLVVFLAPAVGWAVRNIAKLIEWINRIPFLGGSSGSQAGQINLSGGNTRLQPIRLPGSVLNNTTNNTTTNYPSVQVNQNTTINGATDIDAVESQLTQRDNELFALLTPRLAR